MLCLLSGLLVTACSEKSPTWTCPEIVDAPLLEAIYQGGRMYGYGEHPTFPHQAAGAAGFTALADTTESILTITYLVEGVQVVETWHLERTY
jgi:hypothetical protein